MGFVEEFNGLGFNRLGVAFTLEEVMLEIYRIVDKNVVRAQELGYEDNKHRFVLIMPGRPYTLTLNIMWNEADPKEGVVSWAVDIKEESINPRLAQLYPEHAKDVASFNKALKQAHAKDHAIKDANDMKLVTDDVEYNTLKARPNILSQTLSNPERAEKLKVYILEQNIPAIWHLLTERKLYIDKEKTGFQHLGRREISYQEGSDAQPESDAVMFYLKHFNSETPPPPPLNLGLLKKSLCGRYGCHMESIQKDQRSESVLESDGECPKNSMLRVYHSNRIIMQR